MTKENKFIKNLYIYGFIISIIGGIISWVSCNQPVPPLITDLATNFNNIPIVQNTTTLEYGAALVALGISILILARICQVCIIPNNVNNVVGDKQ